MRELNATRESVRVITKESMERQAMTDDEDGEVRDGRFMMRGALPARISHSTTNKQSLVSIDRSITAPSINAMMTHLQLLGIFTMASTGLK